MATAISYINKEDGLEYQVTGRTVVLAASACESSRLMLNSKSATHPNGLANSSNVVGKYLHDSTGADMGGIIPALTDRKRYNEDGVGGMHVYTPWWLDNKKLDFPRGYHIEYGGGFGMPLYGFSWGIEKLNGTIPVNGKTKEAGGYGASLKQDYRNYFGAHVGMAGRGETVAREDNYCEIDPTVVDKYGIPVLRFHTNYSEYEIKQAKHMKETFAEILHSMGAVVTWGGDDGPENNYGLHNPGKIIHEAGTARMGSDPRSSALINITRRMIVKTWFVMGWCRFLFPRLIKTSPGPSLHLHYNRRNIWLMKWKKKIFKNFIYGIERFLYHG